MIKNKKRFLRLALELLCLMLTVCMLVGALPTVAEETAALEETPATTVVLVRAAKTIPIGTRITDAYLETVEITNKNIPTGVVTDTTKVVSQYAATDIFEGEYIYADMLSSAAVSKVNTDLLIKPIVQSKNDYVVVTDYITANTGEDVAPFVQQLIDENPNKMIIFPDGVYTFASPVCTSAAGKTSNSILLSDGAVIKASDDFKGKSGNNSLFALGGARSANDIVSEGSYYTLQGGTLDGNGKADGVLILSGRESVVRNMCIKNVRVGITVDEGANNGSSDCDFEDLVIIGNGENNSFGVKVIGYDNTFSNIRIYNMHTGFHCGSGGNLIKSIYVYNDTDVHTWAASNVGIHLASSNWISECHVENAAKAYSFGAGCALWNSTAKWSSNIWKNQTAFAFNGQKLTMSGCRVEFLNGEGITTTLTNESGDDVDYEFIEGTAVKGTITDDSHVKFMRFDKDLIPIQ